MAFQNMLEIKNLSPEINAEIKRIYKTWKTDFIGVGVASYVFPQTFREGAQKIHNMHLRSDDIFVVTFPRSGTTWSQELVWLIANDFDFETAKSKPLVERYPFIEIPFFKLVYEPNGLEEAAEIDNSKQKLLDELQFNSLEQVDKMTCRRFIKTHLPLSILPQELLWTCKVVYVARDPRDVCVSNYHLNCLVAKINGFCGDFKSFWNLFKKDLIPWCPIFAHIKEAWAKRHHPNMMFLFYEEMTKDMPSVIRKVSKFLGKECTEEQIITLCEHLNFDNFSKNKAVQLSTMEENGLLKKGESFIRKGKVGGWREYFNDAEMYAEAEQWLSDNLRDTDLRFPDV